MIWVIAGTLDGRTLAVEIQKRTGEDVLVTVVSQYGAELAAHKGITVHTGRLDQEAMQNLIKEHNVRLLIDASHPYAQNISNTVISMVSYLNERNITEKKIKYVRFERKILDYGTENVFQFKSLKELIVFLNKFENKNILSTLGSNSLVELRSIEEKNNLFIRILPTTVSIQNAEKLGYLPKNIIAMQGPFSKEMNVAILKNYKID